MFKFWKNNFKRKASDVSAIKDEAVALQEHIKQLQRELKAKELELAKIEQMFLYQQEKNEALNKQLKLFREMIEEQDTTIKYNS